MFHAIAIAPIFLIVSSVLAVAEPPPTAGQASFPFYRYARLKALVVEVEQMSAESMREVAKTLADGMTENGVGPQELRINDDGRRGTFLMTDNDNRRVTRVVLKALPGSSARILAVIGSWPAGLDAHLSGQLDQEASAIEHQHAFDRGVENIFYEWNPPR